MLSDSEIMEDALQTVTADVTDGLCTTQYIENPHDCCKPEAEDYEANEVDLPNVKAEPAINESDEEFPNCSVKVRFNIFCNGSAKHSEI